MNKLDDKVIIDREILQYLLDQIRGYAKHFDVDDIEEFPICQRAKQALAQDLTGWVAVPAEPTAKMVYAGRNALLNAYIHPMMDASVAAMLKASPPLPGGGE
jgi:hypothetical protein